MFWQTSRFSIDLSQPKVMGIVNVTPDSFSDGGRWMTLGDAMGRCEQLLADGADILDLGAESTRPGAPSVSVMDELTRLLPVLREAIKLGGPVSVDTYKPEVMRAALDEGADIINDIWAFRQPATAVCHSAKEIVAAHPLCGLCVMHMHRDPQTMQVNPMSGDVVSSVIDFLKHSSNHLQALGIQKDRILLDPGIGFGKTPQQNLQLLARQNELLDAGHGVLVGWSRKSTLGVVLGDGSGGGAATHVMQSRLVPSVTAALLAVQKGARVLRVHDVTETVQMLKVWHAVESAGIA